MTGPGNENPDPARADTPPVPSPESPWPAPPPPAAGWPPPNAPQTRNWPPPNPPQAPASVRPTDRWGSQPTDSWTPPIAAPDRPSDQPPPPGGGWPPSGQWQAPPAGQWQAPAGQWSPPSPPTSWPAAGGWPPAAGAPPGRGWPPGSWPPAYPGAGSWAYSPDGPVWIRARPRGFFGRHRVAIIVGAFLLAIVLIVGSCVAMVAPTFGAFVTIEQRSGGRVSSIDYTNGTIEIRLEPGAGASDGYEIACNVVRPALSGTLLSSEPFEVLTSDGRVVADQNTPCQ